MNRLKELRESRKLTIKEAAKILGLRNDQYAFIEDGLLDNVKEVTDNFETWEFKLKRSPKKSEMLCTPHPVVLTLEPFKGGTGKSTSIINIGMVLADMGYQVLMVDTTGQCDITNLFLTDELTELAAHLNEIIENGGEITDDDITIHTILDALQKGDDIRNYIIPTKKHQFIDVVASEQGMKTIYSDFLQTKPKREYVLNRAFKGVMAENYYDFILIDVENNAEVPWKHAIYNINDESVYCYGVSECFAESQQQYPTLLNDVAFDAEWADGFQFLGVALSKVSKASKEEYEDSLKDFEESLPSEYKLKTQLRQDVSIPKSKRRHLLLTQMKNANRLKALEDARALTDEILTKIKLFEAKSKEV